MPADTSRLHEWLAEEDAEYHRLIRARKRRVQVIERAERLAASERLLEQQIKHMGEAWDREVASLTERADRLAMAMERLRTEILAGSFFLPDSVYDALHDAHAALAAYRNDQPSDEEA